MRQGVLAINTLKIEATLAGKYKYKPLPQELSAKYREFFEENIPLFLSVEGASEDLFTKTGSLICSGYERIVVGDYGAFVEFTLENANAITFIVKRGQEYRINDPKYSKNVKYEWYTIGDGSDIKIYKQKKRVAYADYKSKMYYISVHEAMAH